MPPRSSHKYIKRTGSKGSYTYFYADGTSSSGSKAKSDHVMRLIVGREKGQHSLSNKQIAEEVGLTSSGSTPPSHLVNGRVQTLRRRKRTGGPTHGYNENQLKEATLQPGTPEYERRVSKIKGELGRRGVSVAPASAAPETAPSRPRRTEAPHLGFGSVAERNLRAAGWNHDVLPDGKHRWIKDARFVVTRSHGGAFKLHDTQTDTNTQHEGLSSVFSKVDEALGAASAQADIDKIKEIRAKLAARGNGLPGTGVEHLESTPEPIPVIRTGRAPGEPPLGSVIPPRSAPEIAPASPRVAAAGAAVAASIRASEALADPEVEATEAPIRRMSETAEAGGNPYLDRAKEVFEKVKGDLSPERQGHVKYMLQAIEAAGPGADKATLKAKYKELSGKGNFSVASTDFGVGTAHSVTEVAENKPPDLPVERMKRGFPAMQFERLRPYLSASFTGNHPTAPPPHPTYNDLKTWSEHGSSQAENITTPGHRVQRAMPQSFYDSISKGANGKAMMPPAWLPLNLTPAWNYIAKKGPAPYQQKAGQGVLLQEFGTVTPGGKIDLQSKEGYLLASLRKYVQMRGGPEQLIDIPKSKLAELGLSHEKIFKAQDVGIAQLKEIIKYKIIDLIELVPFIDAELKAQKVKKSYSLVVGVGERPFEKSNKSQERLKKSLIGKIQRLRSEKKFSYMSKM